MITVTTSTGVTLGFFRSGTGMGVFVNSSKTPGNPSFFPGYKSVEALILTFQKVLVCSGITLEYQTIQIMPDVDCKACHGNGILHQSEEFWGAPCSREDFCECVVEQVPDEFEGIIELTR